jgi:putative membrane protein
MRQYPDSKAKILRDYLAIDRTKLANQRTLLTFLRTALYLLVSAVVVWRVELLQDLWYLGVGAVLLSIATVIIGIISYLRVKRRVDAAYQFENQRIEDREHQLSTELDSARESSYQ